MTNFTRRLRLLVALAGLSGAAACGPVADDVTPTESAVFPPNITAQKNAVWGYYTGLPNGAGSPMMTMYQPDIHCSPITLVSGLFAYRTPSIADAAGNRSCQTDVALQSPTAPSNFWATYEIWQNHVPQVQQDFYATLAINMLCVAAYRRAGWTDAQLAPMCNDSYPQSTTPTVRRWIHDLYYPDQPFWIQ